MSPRNLTQFTLHPVDLNKILFLTITLFSLNFKAVLPESYIRETMSNQTKLGAAKYFHRKVLIISTLFLYSKSMYDVVDCVSYSYKIERVSTNHTLKFFWI